jgi:hypothetical protein
MISTHNHVDMAASLVGAGQFKLTLLPPTQANNSPRPGAVLGRDHGRAARGLAGTPAPRDLPADPGWPRQCGPITTALMEPDDLRRRRLARRWAADPW